MGVAILNLSTMKTDNQVFRAISNLPPNSILALEDVDCATEVVKTRKEEDDDEDNPLPKYGISLSGLLNGLDGITTPDDALFFMTTNFPEKLDSALIRPGRVDVHEVFGLMDTKHQQQMSKLFFDEPISRAEPISPASMQNILISNLHNRQAALDALNNA
jgi:chaperone BCS1